MATLYSGLTHYNLLRYRKKSVGVSYVQSPSWRLRTHRLSCTHLAGNSKCNGWYRRAVQGDYRNPSEKHRNSTGSERTHPTGGDSGQVRKCGTTKSPAGTHTPPRRGRVFLLRARTRYSMGIYWVTKTWQAQLPERRNQWRKGTKSAGFQELRLYRTQESSKQKQWIPSALNSDRHSGENHQVNDESGWVTCEAYDLSLALSWRARPAWLS